MDPGRVASLYIRGVESFLPGNDIAFTLSFQERLDIRRLFEGFKLLVTSHPCLRVRLEPAGDAFSWEALTDSELEAGLAYQRERFERTFTADEVLSRPLPPEQLLAARITRVDSHCVIFQTRHVLANGISTLHWIEEWLSVSMDADPVPNRSQAIRMESKRGPTRNPAKGILSLFGYVAAFLIRAGWNPGRNTVDLTHGKVPSPHKTEFFVKTYVFTPKETPRILQKTRALGLTVSQAVCSAVASAMLLAQPEKSRVCISVPTDLGAFLPGISRLTPGNYTGSLIVQVRRGTEPARQVVRAFNWLRYGVDYWLTRAMGAMARSERRLCETFARTAALPVTDRSPFENLSCAVSSVGTVRLPHIQKHLKSISGTGRTQTILLCVMSLNGCMTIEVSASRDLFDPEEVFAVTDCAVTQLSAPV